ncbi:hypothetical protein SDSG_00078 [Ruegeria phage DSS3-P1]|nr:hypothetical protein SDSG_00078 [Ruegeria phage DSS3-P1]
MGTLPNRRQVLMNFRELLSALPYVKETENGTLDMWSVQPTGHYNTDVQRGRAFAALSLHIMRENDAPFLLAHVLDSWMGTPASHLSLQTGFCLELADAVIAGDPNDAILVPTRPHSFKDMPLREAMLRLPFVCEKPDGTLDTFVVSLSGDSSARQDRGRFHGALACKYLMDTGCNTLFAHMNEIAVYSPEYAEHGAPYRVGMASAVAQVAISGNSRATIHQRAMCPFYREIVENPTGRATQVV